MNDFKRKGFLLLIGHFADVNVFEDTMTREFSYELADIDVIKDLDIDHGLLDKTSNIDGLFDKEFCMKKVILVHKTNDEEYNRIIMRRILELSLEFNISITMYQEDNIKGKAYLAYIGAGVVDYSRSKEVKFARVSKNELTSELLKEAKCISTLANQRVYKETMPIVFENREFDLAYKATTAIINIKTKTSMGGSIKKAYVTPIIFKLNGQISNEDLLGNDSYNNFSVEFKIKITPITKAIKNKYDIFENQSLNILIQDLELISSLSDSNIDINISFDTKKKESFDFKIINGELE